MKGLIVDRTHPVLVRAVPQKNISPFRSQLSDNHLDDAAVENLHTKLGQIR